MSQQRFIANPVPTFADLPEDDPAGTVRQCADTGVFWRCVQVMWQPEDGNGNLQAGLVDAYGDAVI